MGADRGVRDALAKVSNIVWFRLISARPVAIRAERPREAGDAPDGEVGHPREHVHGPRGT
jgi:hypothetical protein